MTVKSVVVLQPGLIFVLPLILQFSALSIAATVHGATNLAKCEAQFLKVTSTNGIPGWKSWNLREIFERKGHNFRDLQMHIAFGEGAIVEVFYRGRQIGNATLEYHENMDSPSRVHISMIFVEPTFEGTGIGTLMYFAMAKAAYLEGRILISSHDLNSNSGPIWERFMRDGLAIKVDNQFTEFRKDVLDSPDFQRLVDSEINRLKLRPGQKVVGDRIE